MDSIANNTKFNNKKLLTTIVNSTGGKSYMDLSSAEEIKNALENDLTGNINKNVGAPESNVEKQPGIVKLQVGPDSQDTFEMKLTDAQAAQGMLAQANNINNNVLNLVE